MSWTSRLKVEFRDALLDRYRREMQLRMFLSDAIGAELSRLAGNGNLEEVCYQAIEELDARDDLDALYLAFRDENPNKPFAQRSDLPPTASERKEDVPSDRRNSPRSTMTEPNPSINLSGATFNAPVNLGNNNKGDLIGMQNNYYGDSSAEVKQAIEDLRDFVVFCAEQHPQLATEPEAQAVIDAEIITDPAPQPKRWQALRAQLRNPERHLQAFKATVVEVAKHEFEQSVVVKAVLTYVDKLSETPDVGA